MEQENFLKDGTYRLVVKGIDEQAKLAYTTFMDHNGEEVIKIIPFGHLEKKLGKDYFKVSKNFNMVVKNKQNTVECEYIPVSLIIKGHRKKQNGRK